MTGVHLMFGLVEVAWGGGVWSVRLLVSLEAWGAGS